VPLKKHPDAKVIETLGGRKHLEKKFSLTRQTTHNWVTRGIPELARYKLAAYAKKLRVKLPEGFSP
jgi:hypothetical protein